jgi:predicted hydrocarbon binding protein
MAEKVFVKSQEGAAEKTVANGVIRIVMDATEEVLGANGLKALLNFAKMPYLIENKPDYSYEKNYTAQEYTRVIISYYDLLGVPGAKSVFRLIGKTIAKRTTGMGLFDAFKDLPPEEKLFKAVELYTVISGRGKALRENGLIVYDNPECSNCFNVESTKPVCAIVSGFLDDMIVWAGIKGMRSVETACKAKGDATCRYEVRPEST